MMAKDRMSQATRDERRTGKIHEQPGQYDNHNISAASAYVITYSPAHEGHILTKENKILFTARDRSEVIDEYQRLVQKDIKTIYGVG